MMITEKKEKDKMNQSNLNEFKYGTLKTINGQQVYIPFKKGKEKIFNNNKSMIETFLKFQLIKDSKCPSNEWAISERTAKKKTWSKVKKASAFGGIGIPCGKVNGCFVVDLDDYKWTDDHPFIQKFGKGDYHKKFDTYVQQSAGGAWHLFFKYDEEFTNKCHKQTGIDILSDRNESGEYAGKYVVGAGTTIRITEKMKIKYNTTKNYGTYKILNDKPLTECPEDLKQWLRENIYIDKDVVRTKKEKNQKEVAISNTAEYFKYNLSEAKVSMICEALYKKQPKYFTEYRSGEDWSYLVFTTAMKSIGHHKIWNKYSKLYADGNYDKDENQQIWNGIKQYNEYNCFNKILLEIDERTLLDYVKYKPVFEDTIKYSKEGEWNKLGIHIKLPNEDVQIKSGTGTGKTTIVKEYLKNKKRNFISVVSRRSLAYEQYKTFIEAGIDCVWYENFEGGKIPENKNVVIQIDSIMKIYSYLNNAHKYTIFLDEYSSLIEHLITSPTLAKTRSVVFKVFKKLLNKSRQVISVDADLTKHTLNFLSLCGRPLNVWNNTFQHNKGVPSKEWFNIEQMVEDMKKLDKFMLCMDSKTSALALAEKHFDCQALEHIDEQTVVINGKEVNKYEMTVFKDSKGLILVVSAENDYIPNLDEWNRVIFSPKIVYGLDSIMKRQVYCIFKEHTISPKAMFQQVARCRNIIQLNYMFCKKKFVNPAFIDIPEVINSNNQRLEFVDWIEVCDEEDVKFYKQILATIQYNEDCYKTNKFVHFKNMLKEKGFVKKADAVFQTSISDLRKMEEEHKKKQIDQFDNAKPAHLERNNILKIPDDQMKTYCQLFLNDTAFQQYSNIRKYLINSEEDINEKLVEQEDFNVNKVKTSNYQIVLIQKFLKFVEAKDKFNIQSQKKLTKEEGDKWFGFLETAFRFRFKKDKPDMTTFVGVDTVILKCLKQLFGGNFKLKHELTEAQIKSGNTQMTFSKTNLTSTTRKTIDGVKISIVKLNKTFFEKVSEVISFSYGMEFKYKDFLSLEGWSDPDDAEDEFEAEVEALEPEKFGKSGKTLNWLINNSTIKEIKTLLNDGNLTKEECDILLKKKKDNE